ncbi:GAF domain-containing protein [Streptomyces sp. NPDC046942]|uniref:sensor histidine kinase n=1 Tax=Streptomyces sp. NPDC046942 TaxID=3155137 RepID=UPI0033D80B17
MDECLDELQARVDAMRSMRDRVHPLLEAVLAVGQGLELPVVLRHIVEAAVALVDAEFGALGVIGEDRKLSAFVPVGMSDGLRERIGPLPQGHGVLGLLIRYPEPVRIAEISEHPDFYGFPEHHPAMHSFLGVPIRVRDEVFGNLYLTNKRGAQAFDAEDEAVVSTLSVAAGVAIENARLYEEGRRREAWLEAGADVTSGLLSGRPRREVLQLIAEHARRNTSADLGVIVVPVEGTDELHTVLAVGEGAQKYTGLRPTGPEGLLRAAFDGPVVSADVAHDPLTSEEETELLAGLGPVAAVPLGTGVAARGILLIARGKDGGRFKEAETEPLLRFAGQAALAMELADRRRDAERLAVFEDRERIARDLHDLAIQRLFASGMGLQGLQRLVQGPPEAAERLAQTVDDLDTTIKIIRSTVFGLRTHEGGPERQTLRGRVVATLEAATAPLGFAPALRLEGLLDSEVPEAVADHLIPVLAEALSNCARHADASAVDVHLAVGRGELRLTVTDNGSGMPESVRRSGLANLENRATALSGRFTVEKPSGGGTRLRWNVPLLGGRAAARGAENAS